MKELLDKLTREPNLVTGALTATFNLLVLLSVIDMSGEAIAGVNIAVGAWFMFLRQFVTPSSEVIAQQKLGEAVKATAKAERAWGLAENTVVEVNKAA